MSSKKITLALAAIMALSLASCGDQKTSVSDSGEVSTSTSTEENYPETNVKLKTQTSSIEVGNEATISAIVNTDGDDSTVNFSMDTTSATVVSFSTSTDGVVRVKVTALKVGTATVTATSVVNPEATATIKIAVVDPLPTPETVFNHLITLDNYTITSGDYDSTNTSNPKSPTNVVKVTSNAVTLTNISGNPLLVKSADTSVSWYGITLGKTNNEAVYMGYKNNKFITTDAELVKTDKGFLDATDFAGAGTDAHSPNDVSGFFSFKAFNPSWFSSLTKSFTNTYTIEGDKAAGESDDDYYTSGRMNLAYIETMCWALADTSGYLSFGSSSSDTNFSTLAGEITTSIKVNSLEDILITVTHNGNVYYADISNIGTTDFSGAGFENLNTAITAGFTEGAKTKSTALTDIATALQNCNNNYIQTNYYQYETESSETDIPYDVYYTPNYYFVDYSDTFKNSYKALTNSDWTETSYGYIKKDDGVRKFTYDGQGITISTTVEEGTDANTVFATWNTYIPTFSFISGDNSYIFGDSANSIWQGKTTTYHQTSATVCMKDMYKYYEKKDIDTTIFSKSLAGINCTYDAEGAVDVINCTYGYHLNTTVKDNEYNATFFDLHDLGKATTNAVDALLA